METKYLINNSVIMEHTKNSGQKRETDIDPDNQGSRSHDRIYQKKIHTGSGK